MDIVEDSGLDIKYQDTDLCTGVWTDKQGPFSGNLARTFIQPHQKFNRLLGFENFSSKDKLWIDFEQMQRKHGKEHFDFVPEAFVLPKHMDRLEKAWKEKNESGHNLWIIKPFYVSKALLYNRNNHILP